jgi:hypothetical protein
MALNQMKSLTTGAATVTTAPTLVHRDLEHFISESYNGEKRRFTFCLAWRCSN